MNRLCDQAAVRSQHVTAQLRKDCHIAHASGDQNLLISFAYPFPHCQNVHFLLIGTIRDTNAAGEIDEGDMRSGFLVQFHCKLKQNARQSWIILVRCGIAGEERMDSKVLCTQLLQFFIPLDHLLFRKSIFCIAGVVHNCIADCKRPTRIIPAADRLRNSNQAV